MRKQASTLLEAESRARKASPSLASGSAPRYASRPMSLSMPKHAIRPQRRAPRREVLLGCQVVRERGFKLISSLAFDLSTDGMLVLTGERVLTGEPVFVSFRSPTSTRFFDLEASVVRVVHGRRAHDRGRCLGLSFEQLGDADRARLWEDLASLRLCEPRRAAS